MSVTSNFKISCKNLDLDELGIKLDHLTVPQDLKDASADCIPISMVETDRQKISSLMDYLDSLEQEDEVTNTFWKTSKNYISGFLKYKYENDRDESIILFLDQKENKNFYEDCDLIDLHIENHTLVINSWLWIIVNSDPLIIMNGDCTFFSFINTKSIITQVVIYKDQTEVWSGESSLQQHSVNADLTREMETTTYERYIRDPNEP